ncbi:MAG: hypothetical protein AAFV29_26035, partial [Myxococcota bacterium]
LGGAVAGGKVYGQWPGLRPDDRYEGRDLAVTTDFRTVFEETLIDHLNVSKKAAGFEGLRTSNRLGLFRT